MQVLVSGSQQPALVLQTGYLDVRLADGERREGTGLQSETVTVLSRSPPQLDSHVNIVSDLKAPYHPSSFSSTTTHPTRRPATTRTPRPFWTSPPWQSRTTTGRSRPMITAASVPLRRAKTRRLTRSPRQLTRSL